MTSTGRPVFGTALCLILTATLVVDGLTARNGRCRALERRAVSAPLMPPGRPAL